MQRQLDKGSANELQLSTLITLPAAVTRQRTLPHRLDRHQNEHTDPWTVTVPHPLRAPPGAPRRTYLAIEIIDKRVIQYVSRRHPTPLLRTVTLPVHQVLKSSSPPPRVQNTFYRISWFPIYETRRGGGGGGDRDRRINGWMKNRL